MFQKTDNPYQFKYLQTAITGQGIKECYLPPVPKEQEILFKKEDKFVRQEISDNLKKWIKESMIQREVNPNFVHAQYNKIFEWENQEWQRSTNGVWFWNNGVPTYITAFYYWYLTAWQTYFGYPGYRETDKEITYLLDYIDNDPDCFGLLLNTIRRYGKSSLMGAWIVFRATRNYNHFAGMQGETDDKIKKFYSQMVLKPFHKLPAYYKPTFNTSTRQSNQIEFDIPPKIGKRSSVELDEKDVLESVIDYRASGDTEYDGSKLHSYINEEPGKLVSNSITDRWKIVKPCLRQGRTIIGKAFMGTTVEFMDVANKGGKAYKKLFYESDFDGRGGDGRTKSGMYACFLPGDCAYEGYFDDYGHPLRDRAKAALLLEREAVKDNPKDLSDLIRKYPLSISEIFYLNTERCEFNATVLQDRRAEIDMSIEPMFDRFNLEWRGGERLTKVIVKRNPNGWLKANWLPADMEKDTNLVDSRPQGGTMHHFPKNDFAFCTGFDPIDHGVSIESREVSEEFQDSRRSRPVLTVKRKYDVTIDGALTQEILEERARAKYAYKTNKYVMMMDTRPNDPNVLYERVLLVCWLMGCSLHVEQQKPGVINWFRDANCSAFIMNRHIPVASKRVNPYDEGTPASPMMIQEYTAALSTYVEYFGHTIPFRELVEDLLLFNPKKTTEFDYAVSMGFCELAVNMKPKVKQVSLKDISEFFSRPLIR